MTIFFDRAELVPVGCVSFKHGTETCSQTRSVIINRWSLLRWILLHYLNGKSFRYGFQLTDNDWQNYAAKRRIVYQNIFSTCRNQTSEYKLDKAERWTQPGLVNQVWIVEETNRQKGAVEAVPVWLYGTVQATFTIQKGSWKWAACTLNNDCHDWCFQSTNCYVSAFGLSRTLPPLKMNGWTFGMYLLHADNISL